jgi:hypothetical protein
VSFIDALTDYGADPSIPGVASYTRGAIIQARVAQGWSIGSIKAELGTNSLSIRDTQMSALIRAEQARQATGTSAAQIGVDYATGELLPSEPPDFWTGNYVHKVTLTTRSLRSDGSYQLSTTTQAVKSGVPLSAEDATSDALNQMMQEPEDGEEPTGPDLSQVLTTQLSGVWYDVDQRAFRRSIGIG